jgi:hypothetical protein
MIRLPDGFQLTTAMHSALLFLLYAVLATATYICIVCIRRIYFHPFTNIPGPFLAKLTNAYSAYHAAKGDTHVMIQRLHEQHGSSFPSKARMGKILTQS